MDSCRKVACLEALFSQEFLCVLGHFFGTGAQMIIISM